MDIDAATTGSNGNNDWKKTVTCYNCDKKGHLSKECQGPRRPRQNTGNYQGNRFNSNYQGNRSNSGYQGNRNNEGPLKGKALALHIKAMITNMDPEDAKEFQENWDESPADFPEGEQ